MIENKKKPHMNFGFETISIRLASPDTIRDWSYGEVRKAETVNYRTLRPERDGLFCERIFGTTKDWECYCGKFKSGRYKGVICDHCGVEVTHSRVRREKMGHVELATPVAHIWYYRSIPSRMGLLLNMTVTQLKSILYFEKYLVIEPASSEYQVGDLITEEECNDCIDEYGDKFIGLIGGEAICELLGRIDVDTEIKQIRQRVQEKVRISDRRLLKRLEILEALKESGNRPEWMMLEVLPIIPPELRPMVQLEGGRFATSDLNDLYRRVINRNNRLKKLFALRAPEIIIRNEKRMLQEAVDALFDNSRRQRSVKGKGNRPLKSLSDLLKGKSGRFRQNLLGKRVDYSGRSVIVIGSDLKIHQMGLPKKMALELFKPFIIKRLLDLELALNIKAARIKIDNEDREVFEALEEVIHDHPVILNRAPTLHRLGIQAFLPKLVEGKAIKLHPLVCHAFNADFDGDQMAIYIPLSPKAQLESWMLMLSAHNFLNPANGSPIVGPTQDMVLGLFLITSHLEGDIGEGKSFCSANEVLYAVDCQAIGLRTRISVMLGNRIIQTTPGRVLFNDIFPKGFPFVNHAINEKEMNKIIADVYDRFGAYELVMMLDKMKELGFSYATHFAPSIGISDLRISAKKEEYVKKADSEVNQVEQAHKSGVITNEERYKKVIEIWTKTNELITDSMFEELQKDQAGFNPIYTMAISGARGSKQQIRQLTGMRGLMTRPSGEIIELAIRSNFKEGLGVLEFFISTHGARKGLADTALKTADAGYLTRRLVDIAQDVIVTEDDCGDREGNLMEALMDGKKIILSLADRIYGRFLAKNLDNPLTKKKLLSAGTMIMRKEIDMINKQGVDSVYVRSALSCKTRQGICAQCYGIDLARLKRVELGEAVGIIAAQSIGQPGTQLTMQTFHVGGVATNLQVQESSHRLDYDVYIRDVIGDTVVNKKGETILTSRGTLVIHRIIQDFYLDKLENIMVKHDQEVVAGEMIASRYKNVDKQVTVDEDGKVFIEEDRLYIIAETQTIPLKIGALIKVKKADLVKKNGILATFDPFNDSIVATKGGVVQFQDIYLGKNFRKDNEGNYRIYEYKREKLSPQLLIDQTSVHVPVGAMVMVRDGQQIDGAAVLIKISSAKEKTRDITGGLPRVEELFEARRPKDASTLATRSGVIEDKNEVIKEKRVIYIVSDSSDPGSNGAADKVKVSIPMRKRLRVHDSDDVQKGDQLDEGGMDPHEILEVQGLEALHDFLIHEIQDVYRLQGVYINEKHIEIIVRQMLRKVEVTDIGDTNFVVQQQVDRFHFEDENERVKEEGGVPAQAKQILLGVTRASLNTESFISAASFQETAKVLTDAAIKGKEDRLVGLKENVIVGHLIPAGTGLKKYREIGVYYKKYGDIQRLQAKKMRDLDEYVKKEIKDPQYSEK